VKIINNTKSLRKIILAIGIIVLIISSVIFIIGAIKYPDVERDITCHVKAQNTTWITLENIEYTNDLEGYFEVEEGSVDFIITSRAWKHSWGMLTIGLFDEITGVYEQENVSEDRFEIKINEFDDVFFYSEEWYLVFDNRNYEQEKNIELHYSLHPMMRDTFNTIALALFICSICIFIIFVVLALSQGENEKRLQYREQFSNISTTKRIKMPIKSNVTCPICSTAFQVNGSNESFHTQCPNCACAFMVKLA
jgi:hypothetical protein